MRSSVRSPGPRSDESPLPGLGEAHFRGGGTASRQSRHPTTPGLLPMWPSPGLFGKPFSGPSALVCLGPGPTESSAGIGKWGAAEEKEPGDLLTRRCDCRGTVISCRAHFKTYAGTLFCFQPSSSLWHDAFCVLVLTSAGAIQGTAFSHTIWVSQITSICSENRHRLLVRVVEGPAPSETV